MKKPLAIIAGKMVSLYATALAGVGRVTLLGSLWSFSLMQSSLRPSSSGIAVTS
jgi:hypothetical protein